MATTNVRRRYSDQRRPEYKIYNDHFDRFLKQSHVFNSGDQKLNVFSIIWNRNNIEDYLRELEGIKDTRKYRNENNVMFPCLILQAETALDECKNRFIRFQEQKEAQGYAVPDKEPRDIFEARMKAEAYLDLLRREAEFLRNQLVKLNEVKESEANDRMLAYGPLGVGQLRNGDLVLIDHQKVERVKGVLVITEPASPYKGMKVSDYRQFVNEPWSANYKAESKTLEKKQMAERLATGHSNTVVPKSLGLFKVSRGSLPKWPKGVKNHLEIVETIGES